MTDRRFIEESFPVKEIGITSSKERRKGHISGLHLWWARRPLAASRATAYSSLISIPRETYDWQTECNFLVELSKWDNSNNTLILGKARQNILKVHANRLSEELNRNVTEGDIETGLYPFPRVLDPFAGGGAIPLESLRLGCEVYANDYNPVAYLLLKSTLFFPQYFGKAVEEKSVSSFFNGIITETRSINPLLDAIDKWGQWVFEEASKDLNQFYPFDFDGSIPTSYIWARTIPCQNPNCDIDIPLMGQFWLANKPKKKVSLYPEIIDGEVVFKIVGDGYERWPEGFEPGTGTVTRAVVVCPNCGTIIDGGTTRSLFNEGKNGERLVAVCLKKLGETNKFYRIASKEDIQVIHNAEKVLKDKEGKLIHDWGMSPFPDETFPSDVRMISEPLGSAQNYGFNSWGDLFNYRQKLALITLIEKVRAAHAIMVGEENDQDFARAVTTYLALAIDRLATRCSNISVWHRGSEGVEKIYARAALTMQWEYAESNVLQTDTVSGFIKNVTRIMEVVEHLGGIDKYAEVNQGSAIHLTYPTNYFDAVFTDPPYYDNVPYAYLSDFFYVWLKRSIGHLYPSVFTTPLTPKANEIVAYSIREGKSFNGKAQFEDFLGKSFCEIYRVLKPDGIAIIVYAHKSTAGWETIINAILDSGLVVTGAWPIETEVRARLTARETASLASSIYIVARKTMRQPIGYYKDIRNELRDYLDSKLKRLWEEGIGGADFFIAAIGSSIEVFGKYEQVIDYEGNIVRANRLLEEVRTIATDYAVQQILHNGFTNEISEITRLYVLWRWNYGEARVPFDEGRKLAQSCGVDLAQEWGKGGFVKKEKEVYTITWPTTA